MFRPFFAVCCSYFATCGFAVTATVRMLDLRSRDPGFDSRSGRYQVVTSQIVDCLRTDEL